MSRRPTAHERYKQMLVDKYGSVLPNGREAPVASASWHLCIAASRSGTGSTFGYHVEFWRETRGMGKLESYTVPRRYSAARTDRRPLILASVEKSAAEQLAAPDAARVASLAQSLRLLLLEDEPERWRVHVHDDAHGGWHIVPADCRNTFESQGGQRS